MTKRKPRRKAKTPTRKGSTGLWAIAALACLGWVVFDTHQGTIMPYAESFFGASPESERVAAARLPERATPSQIPKSAPPVRTAARPQESAPPRPAHQSEPARAAPRPAAPVVAARRNDPAEIATPQRRPAAATAAAAPARGAGTAARRTPLYREPATTAPVWVTLEAGQPLRVTERKGGWRRVEAGIFTGWIEADAVRANVPTPPAERQVSAPEMPMRQAAAGSRAGPVPPGAIPAAGR